MLKIDDHGVCRGNTGPILAQWRRPVASTVAPDPPYPTMCSELHCCSVMATKMACKGGTFVHQCGFFRLTNYSLTTMLWLIKMKPSYNIVCIYVLTELVYYGVPSTAMNAVWLSLLMAGKK